MGFHVDLPDVVRFALRRLQNAGFSAYVVGGCVRDSLRGRKPADWDVTTSAHPLEIQNVFSDEQVIKTGIQHGTVTLVKNQMPIEITTYRQEGNYSDFRRPDTVEFVNDIREDLKRRDFTINAMAYSPQTGLLDLFGGFSDLQNGILRAVGKPGERFEEDALRIMRCLRFAAVFSFSIEEATGAALLEKKKLLGNISAERIYIEFKKMMTALAPGEIMTQFFPVLEEIFSAAVPTDLTFMNRLESDLILRLTAFFCGIYAKEKRIEYTKRALDSLKTEKKIKNKVLQLTEAVNRQLPTEIYSIRKELSRMGEEQFARWVNIKEILENVPVTDVLRNFKRIKREKLCYCIKDLKVDGNDLMKDGNTGTEIGWNLRFLLNAVMAGRVNNQKEDLLQYLHQQKKDWNK